MDCRWKPSKRAAARLTARADPPRRRPPPGADPLAGLLPPRHRGTPGQSRTSKLPRLPPPQTTPATRPARQMIKKLRFLVSANICPPSRISPNGNSGFAVQKWMIVKWNSPWQIGCTQPATAFTYLPVVEWGEDDNPKTRKRQRTRRRRAEQNTQLRCSELPGKEAPSPESARPPPMIDMMISDEPIFVFSPSPSTPSAKIVGYMTDMKKLEEKMHHNPAHPGIKTPIAMRSTLTTL